MAGPEQRNPEMGPQPHLAQPSWGGQLSTSSVGTVNQGPRGPKKERRDTASAFEEDESRGLGLREAGQRDPTPGDEGFMGEGSGPVEGEAKEAGELL